MQIVKHERRDTYFKYINRLFDLLVEYASFLLLYNLALKRCVGLLVALFQPLCKE
jgi:hypothetical protein